MKHDYPVMPRATQRHSFVGNVPPFIHWSRTWNRMEQVAFGLSVHLRFITILGQVFPRPISANPWLKFVLSFFIPLFKSLHRITFSIPFRASNYQILDKKILLIFLLKLSGLKSDFTLTLGYINPTTNNPTLINKHHLISLHFFFPFNG